MQIEWNFVVVVVVDQMQDAINSAFFKAVLLCIKLTRERTRKMRNLV